MFLKNCVPGLLALALGIGVLTSGCSSQRIMLTGTVNTTQLLQYDDKYQELAQQYLQERVKAAEVVRKKVALMGGTIKDQKSYDELTKMEKDLNEKWLKKTREYTETKMQVISKATEEVAKEKGIDIVILDSTEMPTVEYGGVDISADVLRQMPGFAGGSTEAPKANASQPEGNK